MLNKQEVRKVRIFSDLTGSEEHSFPSDCYKLIFPSLVWFFFSDSNQWVFSPSLSTHEPFILFSLPCSFEDGSDRTTWAATCSSAKGKPPQENWDLEISSSRWLLPQNGSEDFQKIIIIKKPVHEAL